MYYESSRNSEKGFYIYRSSIIFRWKKMEHHDVIAECGRFTLDKCREEVFRTTNSRSTPPLGL